MAVAFSQLIPTIRALGRALERALRERGAPSAITPSELERYQQLPMFSAEQARYLNFTAHIWGRYFVLDLERTPVIKVKLVVEGKV